MKSVMLGSRAMRGVLTCLSLLAVLAGARTASLAQVGQPWAWGSNNEGELGDRTTTTRNAPVSVFGLTDVMQMSGGSWHSFALNADGTLWGWGLNDNGQIGDGSSIQRNKPIKIPSISGVMQIYGGKWHTLAIKSDGTVWGWGHGLWGKLGNGASGNRSTPVQAYFLSGIVQLSGGQDHSLALKSDGTVWSWGRNQRGQLGDSTTDEWRAVPVKVPGLKNVIQIAGGEWYSLALKSDGTVWAWGDNDYGQLGDNSTLSRNFPKQVLGLSSVVQIAAGELHSLALKPDGTVWAWGRNAQGQMGNDTTDDKYLPVQVSGLSGVVQISTGHWHSMALKSDGTLWSWGRNVYRALGDGTSTDRHTPVQTLNLTNQTYIDAGGDFGLSVQAVVLNTAVTTKNVTMQYAKPTSLAATLLDQRGFPLLFQPLVFKIGNTTLSKGVRTSAAGVATLAIPNPSQFFVGQYTLKVNFAADRLYNASAASATLTITKADTKVSVGAFTVQPGQTKFLTATVRRTSDGAYLSNTPLTFKVDGMERGTSTTDGTGKASLSFTGDESLSAGAHALTVEYAGDGNHNASSGAGTLTIAQSPTYTTPSNVSGKVGSTITLKAKLIRTTDKALLVGRAIRFQIDGADVGTATTDATGFAMFSYTILAGTTKGDHPLTALFDGENLYANSSGGKTLTVK